MHTSVNDSDAIRLSFLKIRRRVSCIIKAAVNSDPLPQEGGSEARPCAPGLLPRRLGRKGVRPMKSAVADFIAALFLLGPKQKPRRRQFLQILTGRGSQRGSGEHNRSKMVGALRSFFFCLRFGIRFVDRTCNLLCICFLPGKQEKALQAEGCERKGMKESHFSRRFLGK